MKYEIKEILEDIKRHLDYVEETKQASIRDNEIKAMYDYIINLQEENERLRIIEEKYKDSKLYIKDFKEELERYKNIIDEIESIVYADIPNIDVRISIQEALDRLKGE